MEYIDSEIETTTIEDKSTDGGLETPFEDDTDFDFAVMDDDDSEESNDADFDFA